MLCLLERAGHAYSKQLAKLRALAAYTECHKGVIGNYDPRCTHSVSDRLAFIIQLTCIGSQNCLLSIHGANGCFWAFVVLVVCAQR